MNVEEILATLIAFPSVVGTPNGAIVDWIRDYCQAAGAEVTVLTGPEGDRSNLFVTIGPTTEAEKGKGGLSIEADPAGMLADCGYRV